MFLALVRMLHDWYTVTDKAKALVRVLLVDFRKAFDLINHNLLLEKLESLQVPKVLVRWIHAFLSDRKQRVKLADDLSDWLSINGGVPQGTKLGPILFLVLINDLCLPCDVTRCTEDVECVVLWFLPSRLRLKKEV